MRDSKEEKVSKRRKGFVERFRRAKGFEKQKVSKLHGEASKHFKLSITRKVFDKRKISNIRVSKFCDPKTVNRNVGGLSGRASVRGFKRLSGKLNIIAYQFSTEDIRTQGAKGETGETRDCSRKLK